MTAARRTHHRSTPALHPGEAGFTFIEVLVAVGIALVVVAAAYAALSGGLSAYERTGAAAREVQVVRALLQRLTRELQAAYFDPKATDLIFEGEEPVEGSLGPASRLTFVTAAGPGPLTEVEYFLQEPEAQPYEAAATPPPGGLYRRATPLVERSAATEAVSVEVGSPEPGVSEQGAALLAPEVVGFEVAYYDPRAGAASGTLGLRGGLTGRDLWEDSWDASTKGYLPRAVRVTLYLGAWPEGGGWTAGAPPSAPSREGERSAEPRKVTFVVTLPTAEASAATEAGPSEGEE